MEAMPGCASLMAGLCHQSAEAEPMTVYCDIVLQYNLTGMTRQQKGSVAQPEPFSNARCHCKESLLKLWRKAPNKDRLLLLAASHV